MLGAAMPLEPPFQTRCPAHPFQAAGRDVYAAPVLRDNGSHTVLCGAPYHDQVSCSSFQAWQPKPSEDRIPSPEPLCPSEVMEGDVNCHSAPQRSLFPIHRGEGPRRPSLCGPSPAYRYHSPARWCPPAEAEHRGPLIGRSQRPSHHQPDADFWDRRGSAASPYPRRPLHNDLHSDGYSTPRIIVRPDQWVDDASDYRGSARNGRGDRFSSCASSRSHYNCDSPRGSLCGSLALSYGGQSIVPPLSPHSSRSLSAFGDHIGCEQVRGVRVRSSSNKALRQPMGESIGVSFYPVGMDIHSGSRREGYLTPTSRQRLEMLRDIDLKYLIQGGDVGFPIYSEFEKFDPHKARATEQKVTVGPSRPILKHHGDASAALSSCSSDSNDSVHTRSYSVASSARSAASMGIRRGRGYTAGYYQAPKDASSTSSSARRYMATGV